MFLVPCCIFSMGTFIKENECLGDAILILEGLGTIGNLLNSHLSLTALHMSKNV